MSAANLVSAVFVGLSAGLATGVTGAGGVMIVVPLLGLLLGFSVHEAIGTSLVVGVVAPLAISYAYYKHGNTDIRSGIWIAIGSILGAQIGALLAVGLPEVGSSGILGLSLCFMGAGIWKRGSNRKAVEFGSQTRRVAVAMILGFVVGIMTGVFGAGGGAMILPILLFVLDFPIHKAIGTSLLIMAITASSGAMGYATHGNISLLDGLVVGLSAGVSGIASARFANKSTEEALTRVLSGLFIFLGVVMTALRFL